MRSIVLISHNLRSCHNVGSLLRTADGLGVVKVFLTGYTPYPLSENDTRLPHIADKMSKQVSKTALGAESSQPWEYRENVFYAIDRLRNEGYKVYALEQTPKSRPLPEFSPPDKLVLVVGREVNGIEQEVLKTCDGTLEIPMHGQKESFNVTQAAAMALYHARYFNT